MHSGGVVVLHHLAVVVAVRDGRPGMQVHKRASEAEDSDDSTDEL